ncbi:IS1203 transposase orfA [Escherichia coli]|uniref:IS1203 transposase orfA n=1 Tax=Escherichia coli TaxID=562 RepID=A0A377CGN3_ECOLX|nr:IS1203 transposase orfA [Escherichia coli]
MTKHNRFPPEVRQRAIRMVLENQNTYNSQWAAICSIAPKIGCTPRHCVSGSVSRSPLMMSRMR